MDEDKRIVILGAGESGVGAALLARAKGYVPFVSDSGKIKSNYKKLLFENSISHEEGVHNEDFLLTADEVIKSPGIPDNITVLDKVREKDIPIYSDIEFASRFTNAKIIAITGTNGKTTTSLLTYYVLKQAGFNICLAGNMGISFAREVIKDKYDYYVLEVSSFQLDHIKYFKPDIGVILNITPDHLDRYDYNFDRYVRSKFRISENMEEEDVLIYNGEDPVINDYLTSHPVTPHTLSMALHKMPHVNGFLNGKYLKFNLPIKPAREVKINLSQLPLRGPHNMVNMMACIMIAKLLNVSDRKLRAGLKSFVNVPHRLEFLGELNKVVFYNDSKATNLDATIKALNSFDQPIIWIAGGIDKGNNYQLITSLIRDKVKGIICLGEDNGRILDAFKDHVDPIMETKEIKKAVKKAYKLADPGDVILLSPACASFDLFKNYADRGDKFKKAVGNLMSKKEKSEK